MIYTVFLGIIMIVSILLILIIMVQNPKGGGLSSSFGGGGAQSIGGGVKGTTNFLDKGTWTLAVIVLLLILLSSLVAPKKGSGTDSSIKETIETRVTNSEDEAVDNESTAEPSSTTATDSIN